MAFTTTYTLDKPYFYECFDESLPYSKRAKPKYFFTCVVSCAWFIWHLCFRRSLLRIVYDHVSGTRVRRILLSQTMVGNQTNAQQSIRL